MKLLSKKEIETLKEHMNKKSVHLFKAKNIQKKLWDKEAFFTWLKTHSPDPALIRFVKKGVEKKAIAKLLQGMPQINTVPAVNARTIDEMIGSGHSIQMRSLQNAFLPLSSLQRELVKELHSFISINAYYTPAHSQAFDKHYDDYDFFVWQLDGEKNWNVQGKSYHLKKGNLLFVPAGATHKVSTLAKDSLHLTLSIHRLSLIDVIKSMGHSNLELSANFYDPNSLYDQLSAFKNAIKKLKPHELTELLIEAWHKKVAQCYFIEDGEIDSVKTTEGTWKLYQDRREFTSR
ncbi:MAG: cupin domain-containing protein [Bacteriovoracaceae bacterium]|nr:cupin domain-containing protein [Bacteriovoracaceae bacterium]